MYDTGDDPYCYPASNLLRNLPGIRDPKALEAFEFALSQQRATEALPPGRFDVAHYKAFHRHLFQDVYEWAGEFRTVNMSKGKSTFCFAQFIDREMRRIFAELSGQELLRGLGRAGFAFGAAHFLVELNAVHPFREGNGRTQLLFLRELAIAAGHPLDFSRLDPAAMLEASIAGFRGDEEPMRNLMNKLAEG